MNSNNITRNEILAIIETYEGMLRTNWCPKLLAERTKWCAELAKLEGR